MKKNLLFVAFLLFLQITIIATTQIQINKINESVEELQSEVISSKREYEARINEIKDEIKDEIQDNQMVVTIEDNEVPLSSNPYQETKKKNEEPEEKIEKETEEADKEKVNINETNEIKVKEVETETKQEKVQQETVQVETKKEEPVETVINIPQEERIQEVKVEEPVVYVTGNELIDGINNARRSAGLVELVYDASLTQAAQMRAQEISISFSHARPDGSEFHTTNYSSYGEVLGRRHKKGSDCVAHWMSSGEHASVILDGEYRKIGVATYYDANGTAHYAAEFGY